MKRIRKAAAKKENGKGFGSHFFDTKEKIIGVCAAGIVLLGIIIVLLFVESSYDKLVIKNNTDIDLENLSMSFVNEEDTLTTPIVTGEVKANSTFTKQLDDFKLIFSNANLELRFNFDGHDNLLTDVGTFIDNFNGKISVTFTKTDDPNVIGMKVKASNGIFQTNTIDCNEEFTINISEGKIYQ